MKNQGRNGKLILPAIAGRMGVRDYYVSTMTMRDIAARVGWADDFIKDKSIERKLQREMKGKRVEEIKGYLAGNDERFFNAIVIGVFGRPKWQSFSKLPSPFDRLQKSLGFITLSRSDKMYAMDGQHRLAGIQRYVAEHGREDLLGDLDESVGVVFLSHEDNREGRTRSRRLFTVLNKKAVRVAARDIIYLDEDDAMAILTRKFILQEKGLFSLKEGRINEAATNQMPAKDESALTTVGVLYDSLASIVPLITGKTKKYLSDRRLSDEALDGIFRQATVFFQYLIENIPTIKGYFHEGSRLGDRLKLIERYRNPKTGGHLMFRPMGFKVVVEVCCAIIRHKAKGNSSQYSDEIMRESVAELKELAGYMRLDQAPCVNLIWDQTKGTITTKNFRKLKFVYLTMLGKCAGKRYYSKGQELAKEYHEITGSTLPEIQKG